MNIFIPAPSLVPANVSAKATGNTTIHVQWSFTDNVSFKGFSVKYEAIGHPARNGIDTVSGRTSEITLKRLRMFTKYKIRVAAHTTKVGNYSKEVYATTWEGGK